MYKLKKASFMLYEKFNYYLIKNSFSLNVVDSNIYIYILKNN